MSRWSTLPSVVRNQLGLKRDARAGGLAAQLDMLSEGMRADLIIGNNVLAQVPDLNDFVGGMKILLAPQGVVTLEFPHLERLLAENQYDTIYHEHFSYFSLVTIEFLAAKHGLRIHDIDLLKSHGGSLRVYLVHEESAHPTTPAVRDLLAHETAIGMKTMRYYTDFAARVRASKRNLLSFLIQAKNEGKRICAYGAPGKGNTLLNYCGIGPDFIDFAVDRNPYKHGRYTPGQHIPIRPVEAIDEAKPDYLLILPWNLKDEIVQQMRHVSDWGCKFVVPIPTTTIIDPATVPVRK